MICVPYIRFYIFFPCNFDKLTYFSTDNVDFRNAIFEKCGIRDCSVSLQRIDETDFPQANSELQLKASGTVHSNSNISWFPAHSTVQKNSFDALSSLVVYQNRNGIWSRLAARSGFHYSFFNFVQ